MRSNAMTPVKRTLTDTILQQADFIDRLKDFILRHHNQLELGDIEDAILVGNIVDEHKCA